MTCHVHLMRHVHPLINVTTRAVYAYKTVQAETQHSGVVVE
ncbi:MAG: hypothetical protein ACO2PN_29250 [Pyrobaculum sp.]